MIKNINQIKAAALVSALSMLGACQAEQDYSSPLEIVRTETLSLVLGDAPKSTKVDVLGTDPGTVSWTAGDEVAVYVSGTGANAYQTKTVSDDAINLPLADGQYRAHYAVYPAASAVAASYGNPTLKVTYPTEYSLVGKTAETFSPVPMVALNTGGDELVFYHVGGLLRLTVNKVPATAQTIKLTFKTSADAEFNVTGTYTVTGGGTTSAALSDGTGLGNVVTYTLADAAIGSQQDVTLNVPLPQGDYSTMTKILVQAYDTSSDLVAQSEYSSVSWETLGRAYGRKLTADFGSASVTITLDPASAATIWKGQASSSAYTVSTNTGAGPVGWLISGSSSDSSVDTSVATIDSSTGLITGTAAGTAYVYATTNGGAVTSSAVPVYVNAVTGITMSPTSKTIAPSGSATLTATLNHTSNGTIASYPSVSVSWSSANTSYVTVTSSSSTASYTGGSYKATMTVNARSTKGGPYNVTASISGNSITSSASVSAICAVTVNEVIVEVNTPEATKTANMYTFNGIKMSEGILKYSGSDWSITSAEDAVMCLSQYGGSLSAPTRYYFNWSGTTAGVGLKALFGSTGSGNSEVLTTNNIIVKDENGANLYDVGKCRVPTPNEWAKICSLPSDYSKQATVNGNPNRRRGLVKVNLSSKVGSKSFDSITKSSSVICMVLFPDGCNITVADSYIQLATTSAGSISADGITKTLSYADYQLLLNAGCVVLPVAGYSNTWWYSAGYYGNYWSATTDSDSSSYAYSLYFGSGYFYTIYCRGKDSGGYLPVRLVQN